MPARRTLGEGGRTDGGGNGKTAKRRNGEERETWENARRGRRGRKKRQKEETRKVARLRVSYGLGKNQSSNPLGRKMGAERLSVTGLGDFSDPIFLTSLPWSGVGANLQSVGRKKAHRADRAVRESAWRL